MITDIFISIFGFIILSITKTLGLVDFIVIPQFNEALGDLFGYFGYLQGIIPVVADPSMSGLASTIGALDVVNWGLRFVLALYTVKFVLWFFHILPVIGIKQKELPKI